MNANGPDDGRTGHLYASPSAPDALELGTHQIDLLGKEPQEEFSDRDALGLGVRDACHDRGCNEQKRKQREECVVRDCRSVGKVFATDKPHGSVSRCPGRQPQPLDEWTATV